MTSRQPLVLIVTRVGKSSGSLPKVEAKWCSESFNGILRIVETFFSQNVVNRCSQVFFAQSFGHLTNISPRHSSHSDPPDQLSLLRLVVCPWAYRARTEGFQSNNVT